MVITKILIVGLFTLDGRLLRRCLLGNSAICNSLTPLACFQGQQARVAPTFQAIFRRCFGFPGSLLSSVGRTRYSDELPVCVNFGFGLERLSKLLGLTQPVLERMVRRAGVGSDRREVKLHRYRLAARCDAKIDGKQAGSLTFAPVA